LKENELEKRKGENAVLPWVCDHPSEALLDSRIPSLGVQNELQIFQKLCEILILHKRFSAKTWNRVGE
jgi:hypothetical protein